MTVAEARKALSGKLIFGDAEQIKAHRFLEEIETLIEKINACKSKHALFDSKYDIAECLGCLASDCKDEYALEAEKEWRRRKLTARRKSN